MRGRLVFVTVAAIVALPVGTARADSVWWSFVADCQEGSSETVLRVWCFDGFDCVERGSTLYGCGGNCGGPHLLAENVTWTDDECTCSCMLSSGSFPCGAEPTCDATNDYYKCSIRASTTLPYSCDELGYDYICIEPQCAENGEDWYWDSMRWHGYCGSFGTSRDREVTKCAIECSGCSVAGVSVGAAKFWVLAILLVVFCVSFIVSRRMGRR